MTTATPSTEAGPGPTIQDLIAQQNDAFRKLACFGTEPGFSIPGRLFVTHSVIASGEGFVREALQVTGAVETFEIDNDPYGLHDFGSVEVRGQKVFWKIDAYEAGSEFRYGAETPQNPDTTFRVLTVMLASDW